MQPSNFSLKQDLIAAELKCQWRDEWLDLFLSKNVGGYFFIWHFWTTFQYCQNFSVDIAQG
jgi:hypothetical protein